MGQQRVGPDPGATAAYRRTEPNGRRSAVRPRRLRPEHHASPNKFAENESEMCGK